MKHNIRTREKLYFCFAMQDVTQWDHRLCVFVSHRWACLLHLGFEKLNREHKIFKASEVARGGGPWL